MSEPGLFASWYTDALHSLVEAERSYAKAKSELNAATDKLGSAERYLKICQEAFAAAHERLHIRRARAGTRED